MSSLEQHHPLADLRQLRTTPILGSIHALSQCTVPHNPLLQHLLAAISPAKTEAYASVMSYHRRTEIVLVETSKVVPASLEVV